MIHTFRHRNIDPSKWTPEMWDDWWLHVRTNLRQTFGTPQGMTTLSWIMKELHQHGGLDASDPAMIARYNFGRHLWSVLGADTWINEHRITEAMMGLPHEEVEQRLRRIHSGE